MSGRYDPATYDPHLNLGRSSAFGAPSPQPRKKPDALEDFVRFASKVAPVAGTVIGGGIGALGAGLASGGMAAPEGFMLGSALGGGVGQALGAGGTAWADEQDRPDVQAAKDWEAKERERQARAQAALSLLR